MAEVMERKAAKKLDAEFERFDKVMASRRRGSELIELFDRLRESVKFSEEAKPGCYYRLLLRCTQTLPDRDLVELMEAFERNDTDAYLRRLDDEAMLEPLRSRMVSRIFEQCENEVDAAQLPSGLVTAFHRCITTRLAENRSHVLKLLHMAGRSLEALDVICDQTFELWYH